MNMLSSIFLIVLATNLITITVAMDTTFYVGVQITKGLFESSYTAEFESVIKLAVQLVNNKTDGWFDEELSNIKLVYRIDDPKCNFTEAQRVTRRQRSWATSQGGRLDALLGADCSAARFINL